ncbi:hypothetical protein B0H13DRAFT_2326429 [Mycena leptocephala]|nr:hypothetical protein B0H13DRAFT_2326429 [Mycena leptocephala]
MPEPMLDERIVGPNTRRTTSTPSTAQSGLPDDDMDVGGQSAMLRSPANAAVGNSFAAGRLWSAFLTRAVVEQSVRVGAASRMCGKPTPYERVAEADVEACARRGGQMTLTQGMGRVKSSLSTVRTSSDVTAGNTSGEARRCEQRNSDDRMWRASCQRLAGNSMLGGEDFTQLQSTHLRVPLERPGDSELQSVEACVQLSWGSLILSLQRICSRRLGDGAETWRPYFGWDLASENRLVLLTWRAFCFKESTWTWTLVLLTFRIG